MLVQVLTFPVLLSAWSHEVVGAWLLIITIPAYLALSDLGFASAATAEMTAAFVQSRREDQRSIFRGLLVLVVLIAIGLTTICGVVLWLALVLAGDSVAWLGNYAPSIMLMVVYSALQILTRVPVAAMRASDQYVPATLANDTIWTIEAFGVLAIAAYGGTIQDCVVGYVLLRLAGLALLFGFQRIRLQWLRFDLGHFRWAEVQRLLRPSLAGAALPISIAMNLQGMTLLAGVLLGPAAVAVLVPVRTATRFPVQLLAIFSRGSMPEASRAAALGSGRELGTLVQTNFAILGVALLPILVLLTIFGSSLVAFWTLGQIVPAQGLVALLAGAAFLHASWSYSANLLLALGKHIRFAKRAVGVAALTLLAAIPAGAILHLEGLAGAMLAGEMALAVLAIYELRRAWASPSASVSGADTSSPKPRMPKC